jgi:hypothetical protein
VLAGAVLDREGPQRVAYTIGSLALVAALIVVARRTARPAVWAVVTAGVVWALATAELFGAFQ